MAWRIDNAVIRGEIDNTVPGRTNGRIWLIHQEEPLILNLEGDCWRDLAGSLLTFVNPSPDHDLGPPELANPQTGQVGDMTASRKCRVFTDEPDQRDFTWKNMLSLEWFDQSASALADSELPCPSGFSPALLNFRLPEVSSNLVEL